MIGDLQLFYSEMEEKERSGTEVGRMIKKRRHEMGMSIKELAEALHVNRSAIQHWEHGRRVPSAFNALQLSTLLDIRLESLCSRMNRELLEIKPNCPNMTKIFYV